MKPRNGFSRLPADVGAIGFRMVRSLDTKFDFHEMLAINMALQTNLNSEKTAENYQARVNGLKL